MEYPKVKKFASTIAESHGFSNFTIDIVPANEKGEGYLGEIYIVDIKNQNKQFNIIVKLALTNPTVRDKVPIKGAYENEIAFYTKINKACKRFQNERGLQDIYKGFPLFIGSAIEDNHEVLALENLRLQRFQVHDRKILFDKLHVECVLKQYAHFHAVSMAFRDQQPEEFEKIVIPLTDLRKQFMEDVTMFEDFGCQSMTIVKNAVLEMGENELAEVIDKYCRDYCKTFTHYYFYEGDMKVVLHGDCWSNNIMFKNTDSSEGQVIEDVCLIDFQMVNFGTPVHDLCYFIYSNSSEEIINDIDYYLKFYHDHLSSFVKELGSDVEKIYPMSLFKEEWKRYSLLGLLFAVMILKLKLTNKEDVVDLNDFCEDMKPDQMLSAPYDVKKFNKIITAIVKHFYKRGLL